MMSTRQELLASLLKAIELFVHFSQAQVDVVELRLEALVIHEVAFELALVFHPLAFVQNWRELTIEREIQRERERQTEHQRPFSYKSLIYVVIKIFWPIRFENRTVPWFPNFFPSEL